MTKRVYDFELPATVPGFYIGFGINDLANKGLLADIPPALLSRLQSAEGSSIALTKADLDSVGDGAFAELASMAGLAWHEA